MSEALAYVLIALCFGSLLIAMLNGILDRGDNTAGWA